MTDVIYLGVGKDKDSKRKCLSENKKGLILKMLMLLRVRNGARAVQGGARGQIAQQL